jgi:hypothetical protein
MTGVGGIRRGELVNIGALTHNYKTGKLNDLLREVPLYNTPFMLDPAKKPMVLKLSFENKLEQDLPLIYRSLFEHETGQTIELSEVDPDKAGIYIKDRLEVNGYTVAMECYDPNAFTVYDLIAVLNYYESLGYEIHMVVIDYLELIVRGGMERRDEAICDAFQIVRNHCFPRGIAAVTGHQLSSEAQVLAREAPSNFTERVAVGGWYRNSRQLHTKLDLEILQHIVIYNGRKFLMTSRGKHRGGERTPMSYLTFSYEFMPVGGICDDVTADKPGVIYNLQSILNNTGAIEDDTVSFETSAVEEGW